MNKKKSSKSGRFKAVAKTRKELRKQKRKDKKVKRHDFFSKKKKSHNQGDPRVNSGGSTDVKLEKKFGQKKNKDVDNNIENFKMLTTAEKERKNREKEHGRLQRKMKETRKLNLQEANNVEERLIKKLEKQLKLNKRKSKNLPKSFAEDGLDYLLDICDEDKVKNLAKVEETFHDSDSEFEGDMAALLGKKSVPEKNVDSTGMLDECDDDFDGDGSDVDFSDLGDDSSDGDTRDRRDSSKKVQFNDLASDAPKPSDLTNRKKQNKRKVDPTTVDVVPSKKKSKGSLHDRQNIDEPGKFVKVRKAYQESESESESSVSDSQNVHEPGKFLKLRKASQKCVSHLGDSENVAKPGKFVKLRKEFQESDNEAVEDSGSVALDDEEDIGEDGEGKDNGLWEDIYGRLRDKKGNIVRANTGVYIPPALRAQKGTLDEQAHQRLQKLRRQCKGLLNRLTENNLVSIASEFEQLYNNNSRHDMNETLTSLFLESLVAQVLSVERLVKEHCVLIAFLHSRVGSDVGAFVLQTVAKKFDSLFKQNPHVENKELDNVTLILCYLYNFKVVHSKLLLDVLRQLAGRFGPKDLELVLVVLRVSGFCLRKDEPAELKAVILQLQQNATAQVKEHNESRVKFMLEVLLAIKNNNMSRLPGYNPEPVDHLRKLLQSALVNSSTSPELNISLQDLLEADERGRWWVVGSAWAGQAPGSNEEEIKKKPTGPAYSAELLELARRQRMNTEIRRNIFCILMTAQDYQEAFGNLLQLGLKGQQAREIVHVTLDCCLQESKFNKYYCHVLQNFCDYDRMYRMTLQYTLWDKFREVSQLSKLQASNLTQLVLLLILQGGVTLVVFKILDLADMEKAAIRLLRQVLVGLMAAGIETCEQAISRVKPTPQNRLFFSGLRVFLQRFVLGRVQLDDPKRSTVQEQVEHFDDLLMKV